MDYFEKKMNQYDTVARFEFNNACKKISMNNNYDPTNIFEQIISVQEEYGVDMDQYDETLLVLEKAPESYESVLVGEIRTKGTHFKTNDLEDSIIERYIIAMKIMNKYSNDSDNELTLSEFSVE